MTQPTHKKLPRARTFVCDYDASYPAEVRFETYETVADQHDNRPDLEAFHVAFIPTATKAQARQIIKAAPFLRMKEGERVEALARAVDGGAFHENESVRDLHCAPYTVVRRQDEAREKAKAVLRAMNLGGASR